MIQIKVPATSANIGSGFDSLGLAVRMYNTVEMELWDGVLVEALDSAPIPTDEHNLIYKTAKYLFDLCGKPLPGLHIRQENVIPMARGLGSSSACIVAGLTGANLLMGEPLTREDIINMAATMEGHPEDVYKRQFQARSNARRISPALTALNSKTVLRLRTAL